jgi:hypothetical protein
MQGAEAPSLAHLSTNPAKVIRPQCLSRRRAQFGAGDQGVEPRVAVLETTCSRAFAPETLGTSARGIVLGMDGTRFHGRVKPRRAGVAALVRRDPGPTFWPVGVLSRPRGSQVSPARVSSASKDSSRCSARMSRDIATLPSASRLAVWPAGLPGSGLDKRSYAPILTRTSRRGCPRKSEARGDQSWCREVCPRAWKQQRSQSAQYISLDF